MAHALLQDGAAVVPGTRLALASECRAGRGTHVHGAHVLACALGRVCIARGTSGDGDGDSDAVGVGAGTGARACRLPRR